MIRCNSRGVSRSQLELRLSSRLEKLGVGTAHGPLGESRIKNRPRAKKATAHGPRATGSPARTMAKVEALSLFLEHHPSVEFIRFQWVDYAGHLRARVLTVSYCRALAVTSSPLPMSPIALTAASINEWMPDQLSSGVDYISPDYSSIRECPYAPGNAIVMCFVRQFGDDTQSLCPRTLLKSAISIASELGLELKVGFEVEFRCLNRDGTNLEECLAPSSLAAGLRNRCTPIIQEIVRMLLRSGIEVLQFHTEGERGLFEISTGPLPVLQAVDAYIFTRETIQTLFLQNDIIATTHPSPTPEHHGTATQFHLSISPVQEAATDSFLAGILLHLPALCAFSLPLEESYKRVNDYESECGSYVAWGTQNRDVPIRKINNGHWEIRCCDGAANLYLVVAAYLLSGLDGVSAMKELTIQDVFGRPCDKTEDERAKAGIETQLPRTLRDSLEALNRFNWDQLGLTAAVRRYQEMKSFEMGNLASLGPEESRRKLIRYI
jgi:glutamine synthetase